MMWWFWFVVVGAAVGMVLAPGLWVLWEWYRLRRDDYRNGG